MLTPEPNQGGQGAVRYCGCKTPLFRMVLSPWPPNCPSTNKASWSGAFRRSTGYEFAGHGWLKRRGAALDWNQTVEIDQSAWNERRPTGSNRPPAAVPSLFTGRGTNRDAGPPESRGTNKSTHDRKLQGLRRGAPPFTPDPSRGSRWSLKQPTAEKIETLPILPIDKKTLIRVAPARRPALLQ